MGDVVQIESAGSRLGVKYAKVDALWQEFSGERMGRGWRLFALSETPLARALVGSGSDADDTRLVWSSTCEVFSLGYVQRARSVLFSNDPAFRSPGTLEATVRERPPPQLVCCFKVLSNNSFEVLV